MPDILLRTDVEPYGKAYDILSVSDQEMIDLTSRRLAYCATPTVRKRFEPFIRQRALEKVSPSEK